MALLARHAERRIAQRDYSLQSRHAIARLRGCATEMADLPRQAAQKSAIELDVGTIEQQRRLAEPRHNSPRDHVRTPTNRRSEEHTSELQSRQYLVCRLLLEKKKQNI